MPHAPRWMSAPLYIALGWVAVAMLPDILHGGGVAAWCCCSSAARSTRRRGLLRAAAAEPVADVFGHHEFFHACTLLAALCHHIAIYFALFA